MKYWGEFRSLSNELYRVELQKGASTPSREILLGPNSFVINQILGGDTIYTPIKSTSATVQIVANEYLSDLFSTEANGTSVKLFDASGNVLWMGYTQPNVFSAPYDYETETFDIDCYDGLSILEYFDYDTIGAHKGFVNFAQLIDHLLSKTTACTYWYFADNIYLEGDGQQTKANRNILSKITISESNFFNEDDEPMTCKQVLEEVCKYLGVSATFFKDSVIFIDYDAVKDGSTSGSHYYRYTLGNSSSFQSNVSLSKDVSISAADYAGTGATFDILGTYNKVKVKDSLYCVDSIVPSLFDDKELKNIQGYPWTKVVDGSTVDDPGKNWSNGCQGYTTSWYIGGKKVWKDAYNYFTFKARYFTHDKFNHYFFNTSGTSITPDYTAVTTVYTPGDGQGKAVDYTYPTMMGNTIGALFCKIDNSVISDKSASGAWSKKFFGKRQSGQYDFTNYLCLIMNDYSNTSQKLLEINQNNFTKPFFISNKAKILCTGSMQVDDRGNVPIPLANYEENRDDFQYNNLYIKSKLRCGNYYYNSSNGWQSSSATFNLPFYDNEADWGTTTGEHLNGVEYDIRDNTVLSDLASEAGYIINLPDASTSEKAIANVPEFAFYGRSRIDADYRVDRIWLKNFDVKYYMPYEGQEDENATDTEYVYEMDTESTSELSDITFKICTWDGKQCNYSATAYPYGNDYKFVDKLKNDALYHKLIDASEGGTKRAEELLAFKIAKQYDTPTTKIQVVLKNITQNDRFRIAPYSYVKYDNKAWIVDGLECDVANDRATVTLIEKK